MDHSNPHGESGGNPLDMDVDDEGDSLSRRPQDLWRILIVLAVACAVYAFVGRQDAEIEKNAVGDYPAFMAAVAKADAIADPLQRCLDYPDLPGSHWNAETTRAYCEFRNRKTIQLSAIEDLLKQGKADEVDRTFQAYLDTQRSDATQLGLLDIAFVHAGFDVADEHVRQVIDLWKQQSPESAFAFAASGVQYTDAAQQARGDGTIENVSDQQKQRMNQQLALARKDLDRAVALDPTVTAIYPSMIHVGGLRGDDAYMDKAAGLGLKADPSNFGIRAQIMNHARLRWSHHSNDVHFGGVTKQRAEVLSLASKNPLLRMVAQQVAVDRATCGCNRMRAETNRLVVEARDSNLNSASMIELAAALYDADPRLAVELYSESLRFDPTDIDVLRWRSQEMIALGDKSGAAATLAEVSRRFPDDHAMAAQLGNIYAQTGDVKQAEATLLALLQRYPDDYNAMGTLGDLYNHAGHQPEKAEALADALISKYPDKAAGYILRSCNQMDHQLPGVYDTIHYFIDHFGDDPHWKAQTAEMRAYLVKHPEQSGLKGAQNGPAAGNA